MTLAKRRRAASYFWDTNQAREGIRSYIYIIQPFLRFFVVVPTMEPRQPWNETISNHGTETTVERD